MIRSLVRRYVRMVFVALTFLAVGCGGTDAAGGAAQSRTPVPVDDQDSGGGAPGAPFDEEGDDTVVGAPITIPDFSSLDGADFTKRLHEIRRRLAESCGGALCVEVVAVVDDEPDGEPCRITGVPLEGSTVNRGSRVTFVIEEPCDAPPSEEGGDPPPDGSDNPPPDSGVGEPDESTADPDGG